MKIMDVKITGEPDENAEPLFEKFKRVEKQIAETEGREPEGWYWTEGMEGPAPIDFSDESERAAHE